MLIVLFCLAFGGWNMMRIWMKNDNDKPSSWFCCTVSTWLLTNLWMSLLQRRLCLHKNTRFFCSLFFIWPLNLFWVSSLLRTFFPRQKTHFYLDNFSLKNVSSTPEWKTWKHLVNKLYYITWQNSCFLFHGSKLFSIQVKLSPFYVSSLRLFHLQLNLFVVVVYCEWKREQAIIEINANQ